MHGWPEVLYWSMLMSVRMCVWKLHVWKVMIDCEPIVTYLINVTCYVLLRADSEIYFWVRYKGKLFAKFLYVWDGVEDRIRVKLWTVKSRVIVGCRVPYLIAWFEGRSLTY